MKPALYVYGIVDPGALDAAPPVKAVDPRNPPALFEAGQLTAIVSEVDVTEFEGEALERNVSNPDWLEAKVRAHESVLDRIVASATVVPMRFGSIFSTADGLRRMLAENAPALRASLDRVRDRSEWGVKVYCDQRSLIHQLAGPSKESRSGRGYLLQKSAELRAQADAAEAAAVVARDVHASLEAFADDATTMTPRGNDPQPVILNGAYLVRNEERERFMRKVEDLQKDHGSTYAFEVTGPWPPYNFTSADVSGPR